LPIHKWRSLCALNFYTLSKLARFLLAILAFTVAPVYATHIVGGEIFYQKLNNNDYLVTLKVYRDCNSVFQGSLTPFDQPGIVAIYDENGTLIQTELFQHASPTKLPVIVDNPCLKAPPNICVDEAIYQKTISLPPSTLDYILTYQRCCRNESIVNVDGPPPRFSGNNGSTYTTTIPSQKKLPAGTNSSPFFVNFPPLVICLNDDIHFDHSATDPDADSLAYALCDPYVGMSPSNPTPVIPGNIPKAPPYQTVPWKNGYSANDPIDGMPGFKIDPNTGVLTGTPTRLGQYVVGVCVSEFRNGVLLNETKRDFQFNVTVCDPNSVAAASSQESFCEGLTVNFKNNSENAKYFFWNFGDPTTLADTSEDQEPTYTYTDTGKYNIMLIVNRGWPCADTTFTTYEVYPQLRPYFERPESQCFDSHGFDKLKAGGSFQEYATFEWDFGTYGNPTKSYQEEPIKIRFSRPGDHLVTLTIRENGCSKAYTDTLQAHLNPKSAFELLENQGCIPFTAEFTNESTGSSSLSYLWNFGDGNISEEESPNHTYTVAGQYDVWLQVISSGACKDTSTFRWDRLVKANDLPIANLLISQKDVSSFTPTVAFQDLSIGAVRCKLEFGDGNNATDCNVEYTYRDTGMYTIRQIVFTQFGCTDTFTDQVRIRPELLFYAPTAFTPGGDGINELYRPSIYGASKYEFMVINRWGEILYRTQYTTAGWNGKLANGKEAPVDSYVYMAKAWDSFGKEHQYRGTFLLMR
jgi:gliding motility-associated-like protein